MTRYIMVAVLFGYGLWSIRDGFSRYPQENADAQAAGKDILPHPGLDIPFNQIFGDSPSAAVDFDARLLSAKIARRDLAGCSILHAPVIPPVPLDAITAVDQRLWDRKGIAYVDYELPDRKGRILLDDFIYEREPIDEIHKQITDYISDGDAPSEEETSEDKG